MVKPDIKHNYYADLELPTTCSIDEIKKQYRRLALQYHPDRNAGKEEEFVPKFQAIQTAHEILGDPTQKAKYDTDRRKAGLYPTFRPSQPAPGNPYAANSPYPPPPRRTQPGTWTRPQPTTAAGAGAGTAANAGAAPTGAERFTNFPRAAPTARKDPATDRANMFKAWQNMNNSPQYSQPKPAPQPAPQPAPSRPRPPPRMETTMPSEEEIRAGVNYRKPPPQSDAERAAEQRQANWSAFQSMNAGKPGVGRSRTQQTPKKQGFDPNAPGSDERPAADGNYVHRHRSEDFGRPHQQRQAFPPPPPGPPPESPLSAAAAPTSQHRPFADPLRPFKNREEYEIPFAEGNRTRTPYTTFSGEKTAFSSEGLRRSASTRDAAKLSAHGDHTARARSTSPLGRHVHTKGHEAHEDVSPKQRTPTSHPPFVDYSDSDASGDDDPDDDDNSDDPAETLDEYDVRTPMADNHRRPGLASHDDRPKKVPTPRPRRQNGPEDPYSPPTTSNGAASDGERPGMQQKNSTNIFTFPIDHDMFTPNGKSRSEENINTKFSPQGWNGTFTGSSDYFTPPQPSGRKPSPPRSRPRRAEERAGMRSATTNIPNGASSDRNEVPSPRPFGSDGTPGDRQSTPGGMPFNEAEWQKHFRDASWTWPPPPPNKPPSPVKNAAGIQKKPPRKMSRSQHAKSASTGTQDVPRVDEDATIIPDGPDGQPENGAPVGGGTADEGDAMDIDTTPPAQNREPPAQSEGGKEPRLYSVPPSQWRQQQGQQTPNNQPKTSSAARRAQRSSFGSGKLQANLDDLAKVEPLVQSADGLKNLADMSSTLPFESRAANALPTLPLQPQKLQMPALPKAPAPPTKLTKQSWHNFSGDYGAYLGAFHAFNETMLLHFTAREKQARARMAHGMSWLEATGDPSGVSKGASGFGSYLQGVREDETVRETWNLGCERHAEACKDFEKVRERVRKLAAAGGLQEH